MGFMLTWFFRRAGIVGHLFGEIIGPLAVEGFSILFGLFYLVSESRGSGAG